MRLYKLWSPILTLTTVLLATAHPPAMANTAARAQEALLEMQQAFRKGDERRVSSLLPQVRGHALEPLAAYWALRLRLDTAPEAEIQAFLQRHAGTYYEDRLRKALIEERLNLPDRLQRAEALQRVMRIWLVGRTDTVIGAYWPIKGEFDPLPALHRWKEDGELLDQPQRRRIGLPVVDKQHKTLTFHAWYPGCPMQEDAYGIPKPKDTEILVPTLLFVPCVGYGPGGYRLGYGGGFYDRTLASLLPRPLTVGLGYTQGFLDDLEPEPHDVPLDAILNDNGVVWPL